MLNEIEATVILGLLLIVLLVLDKRDDRRKNKERANKERDESGYADHHTTAHDATIDRETSETEHRTKEQAHWRCQTRIGVAATILSALALIGASFGYLSLRKQTRAAWETARIAQDTEIQQLRAYVIARPPSDLLDYWTSPGAAILKVVNVGQTPAYGEYWNYHISHMFVGNNYDTYTSPVPTESDCMLLQGFKKLPSYFNGEVPISVSGRDEASAEDRKLVSEHRKVVILSGKICYHDIFYVEHWVTFCFFWREYNKTLSNAEYCQRGNDADQKPIKQP